MKVVLEFNYPEDKDNMELFVQSVIGKDLAGLPIDNELVGKAIKKRMPTGTEALVCEDIVKRQQLGIKKYGTTVCANPLPLRDWLQHAYEECLDQAVYLRRAMQEIDKETEK